MKQPAKKIGGVARALGITTRALRFYEEQGLVNPTRTPKGTRLYSDENVTRLRVILLMVSADVPIHTIKELSTIRAKSRTGNAASQSVSRLLDKLRETVVERKNRYAELEKELKVTDRIVQQCFGCTLKPTRETCFACTIVPDFRKVFMVKLIAQESVPDSPTPGKRRQRS